MKQLKQFGRFALVGLLNTALDLGILNALLYVSGNDTPLKFFIFKAISFSFATVNSFFLNKYFTFATAEKKISSEAAQFVLVTAVSMTINVLLPTLIFSMLRSSAVLAPAIIANISAFIGIAVSTVFNFVGYKFFVFKK
jgi:putative flippase GtrA